MPEAPTPQGSNASADALEAFRQAGEKAASETQARFTHELGMPFGEHPRQAMDLYYPNVAPQGPVLVFLHGGAFQGGTPRSVGHYGRHFLDAGVIYAAISYRVLPETRIEGSCDDVEAGLQALVGHVTDHGGDPGQIYLGGHSAGATLAAYVGLQPRLPDDFLKGLLLISGSYRFEGRDQSRYDLESPRHVPNLVDHIAHVPGHTIVVGGDADFPNVLPDAAALAEALRARGGSVESFIEPNADHFDANRSIITGAGPVFEATKVMLKI
jgi:arylformamidase